MFARMLCGATAAASVPKNGEMKCKTNAKISPCLQMWNPSEIEIKILYTNMLKDLESMLLYTKCEMITSKNQNDVQQFDCQLDKLLELSLEDILGENMDPRKLFKCHV